MSNTCLVTKLKSSVQGSNLLRLGEYVATLPPVKFALNLSSAVDGTTCTFKLENGNFISYDNTTNYGDTYTMNRHIDNLGIFLSPIDTSKNMVFHNLSKYDSYSLLVNNDNINVLQYTKAYELLFYGGIIDYDKVSEGLNNPNFYKIKSLLDKNAPNFNDNIKFIGNANRFFSKCKKLDTVYIITNNIQSNFKLDVNSLSGSSDTLKTLVIRHGYITVDSDSLGRLYKLNTFSLNYGTHLTNPKIEISDVIEKWMGNGMPARTFSDRLDINQCGIYFTFNGREINISTYSYLTFENKNKYAIYYGTNGIENCKTIISYGATQEEITNWQNSGITVTVID